MITDLRQEMDSCSCILSYKVEQKNMRILCIENRQKKTLPARVLQPRWIGFFLVPSGQTGIYKNQSLSESGTCQAVVELPNEGLVSRFR